MKEFQENHVANLPDAYRKDTDSNNYKILEIERFAVNDLRSALQEIEHVLSLDNATGRTLDLYGERVGQPRGVADDAKYILMIKTKIMRTLSNGSYESVIDAICKTFDCEPSEVVIQETDEPCTIEITTLPLSIINESGLTTSQTLAIIKSMLPVGVAVKSFLFEGTFEFASGEGVYDEEKGFCDVEGGTIGGYLGVTAGDESDTLLPI